VCLLAWNGDVGIVLLCMMGLGVDRGVRARLSLVI
jgi:hypothetical protein